MVHLMCGASCVGAGSVLLQEHSGVTHPICFFSHKFLDAQKNYSAIEKECPSLVWAVQNFHVYLGPNPVTV